MKIILLSNIKGKGKQNDIIDVANGYANFLIKENKAILADEQGLDNLRIKKEKEAAEEKTAIEEALDLKSVIETTVINLQGKTAPNGKLIKPITKAFIVKQLPVKIDPHHTHIVNNIDDKKIVYPGKFTLDIELHKDIKATISVIVHTIC